MTGREPLESEAIPLFNEVVEITKYEYIALIEGSSMQFGHSIDWWVTATASRNVLAGSLFQQCCYLRFIQRLLDDDIRIDEVIVDSHHLADIARKLFAPCEQSVNVVIAVSFGQRVQRLLRPLRNILASLFHVFTPFMLAKIFSAEKAGSPDIPVTLIDTFIYETSFKNGFYDRHYPDIETWLTDGEVARIYYLPTYYKIRNYVQIMKALRAQPRFLLKEDYLKLSDYLFAITHGVRLLSTVRNHSFVFGGLDITALFRTEFYYHFASSSSIEGLLKYRLAMRMREKGIVVNRLINWFENQEIDHGLNAGFRKYSPDTEVVGYQGYVIPRLYLCAYPTEQERLSQVIPDVIAVPGSGWLEVVKAFCPKLKVVTAPAFRFQALWQQEKPSEMSSEGSVLVALPIDVRGAVNILDTISGMSDIGRISFAVKAHPATPKDIINSKLTKPLPESVHFVSGSFDDLIQSVRLLISGASSVCLETIARGIPVIVVGNSFGVTQNSIPDAVPGDIWKLCYSSEQLSDAVSCFLQAAPEEFSVIGKSVREEYFNPVSSASVRKLLGYISA